MFTHYTNKFKVLQTLFHNYVEEDEGQDQVSKGALITYLNEQDMEFVKCVQVILHVGRNPENEGQNPQELYDQTMYAFNRLKGWRPQEIEVRHMVIKIPLNVYFANGLKVLGIAL